MLLVALLTALINVNGAVAALVPVAVVMAVRHRPLAVAAAAAAGVRRARRLAARADRDAGERDRLRRRRRRRRRRLRLLRVRARRRAARRRRDRDRRAVRRAAAAASATPRSIAPDFSDHARTLVEQYALDHAADALLTRRSGVAEVVIPPRSELVGDTRVPGHGHRQRRPRDPRRAAPGRGRWTGETVLAEGDTLLLQGTWAALDAQPRRPGACWSSTRRSSSAARPCRSARAPKRAIAVLAGMVVLLATGAVPAGGRRPARRRRDDPAAAC